MNKPTPEEYRAAVIAAFDKNPFVGRFCPDSGGIIQVPMSEMFNRADHAGPQSSGESSRLQDVLGLRSILG